MIKQIEYEKSQALISEADRALELIGRAIRMAGYRNIQSQVLPMNTSGQLGKDNIFLNVEKKVGFRGSDSLTVRHELSNGVDFDCIGNAITAERTKSYLALQGFLVDRQVGVPKGKKVNGGSLICQSLDRQGRIQNTTLMNGVNGLLLEELNPAQAHAIKGHRLIKVTLQMTDGARLNLTLGRIFATRNL